MTAAGERAEQRTSPVELLWDLVFAFAVTQVTTLLAAHLSWATLGRGLLALALVWWAWSAFVWAVNAQTVGAPSVTAALLVATGFIFVAGLALPGAFGADGSLFAVCYAVVRLIHLGLYADASRRGNASAAAIAGFTLTVLAGMALLVIGSFVGGTGRVILWAGAVAIDYAGPGWLTRARLRGLQRVAVAHFAERYSLFVIICLGESIVSAGAGVLGGPGGRGRVLSAELIVAVASLLVITIGLWWAYFDRSAEQAQARLAGHRDPVLAASDGYSYLHLPIVAGMIIFAAGARALVHGSVDATLSDGSRWALCGGVAVYLLAHLAFCMRLGGGLSRIRLLAGVALLAVAPTAGTIAGWACAATAAAIVVVMCGAEARWLIPRPRVPDESG